MLTTRSTMVKGGIAVYGSDGKLIADVYEDPDNGKIHVYVYKGILHTPEMG